MHSCAFRGIDLIVSAKQFAINLELLFAEVRIGSQFDEHSEETLRIKHVLLIIQKFGVFYLWRRALVSDEFAHSQTALFVVSVLPILLGTGLSAIHPFPAITIDEVLVFSFLILVHNRQETGRTAFAKLTHVQRTNKWLD